MEIDSDLNVDYKSQIIRYYEISMRAPQNIFHWKFLLNFHAACPLFIKLELCYYFKFPCSLKCFLWSPWNETHTDRYTPTRILIRLHACLRACIHHSFGLLVFILSPFFITCFNVSTVPASQPAANLYTRHAIQLKRFQITRYSLRSVLSFGSQRVTVFSAVIRSFIHSFMLLFLVLDVF